jgi:hypothetical protein
LIWPVGRTIAPVSTRIGTDPGTPGRAEKTAGQKKMQAREYPRILRVFICTGTGYRSPSRLAACTPDDPAGQGEGGMALDLAFSDLDPASLADVRRQPHPGSYFYSFIFRIKLRRPYWVSTDGQSEAQPRRLCWSALQATGE